MPYDENGAPAFLQFRSKLAVVDLAGSENMSKSGTEVSPLCAFTAPWSNIDLPDTSSSTMASICTQ